MAKDSKNLRTGIEVRKKDNESTGSLSRRFFQRVRQSEILMETRERQYTRPIKNRRARRKSALVRAQRREEYKILRKWGRKK